MYNNKNDLKVIELNNVCKNFTVGENNYPVLKNISLSISEGDFISITGQSGSGKSTLLYLIGTLEPPSSGKIWVNGKEISNMSDSEKCTIRRKTIGLIYQFYNLVPELTAMQNILLPIMLDNKKVNKYIDKAQELLKLIGLVDKSNCYPSQLSGGQQQRIAIARALINDPDIILADEPTGNLDSQSSKDIINLFKKINKDFKKTIILVTHSNEIANETKQQIKLSDGQIVYQ